MKRTWIKGAALVIVLVVALVACRKKDAPLPDNTAKFETTEQGIPEATASVTVKVLLDRASSAEAPVTIQLTPSAGIVYGTQFTTTPAGTTGTVTIPVLPGASEATFTVAKVAGALFSGDETISFKLISASNGVILGTTNQEYKLTFAEIISTGTGADPVVGQGGGATYGNKVFFDLSANSQTPVQRTKWDLGFFTGDDFRVILNSSTAMMAKQIEKNDLNAVTAADTAGFSGTVGFTQIPSTAALAYIDYPSGDLSRTAIAAVSATASENKVYIVNRGTGIGSPAPARGWKKIRVIRNASGGYTLQHADIAATTFTSVDIAKDPLYFFRYVSFETGSVDVEPARAKWDIAWTYFSNTTPYMGGDAPYTFQDFILQNRNVEVAGFTTNQNSTSTALVKTTVTFDAFTEANLAGLTYNAAQNAIGSNWRAGGSPTNPNPVVTATTYFIIKDGDGNIYKLQFTALTKDGERGFPTFTTVLLKKG
ncbi:MAG: hypothetical protein EOO09_17705 [Chitinophagaceae bacterium]|nr:MAG: hypothetical protein EOO09_17705 [Chitinophagaceae bacterium]